MLLGSLNDGCLLFGRVSDLVHAAQVVAYRHRKHSPEEGEVTLPLNKEFRSGAGFSDAAGSA
jgi:hypothetical protein